MLPGSHLIISCVFVSFLNSICGQSVEPTENKCTQPIVTGFCFASIPRYGFFSEKGRCEQFIYGGCGGNENNFESIDECFSQCGGNPPTNEIGCDRGKCDWRTFGPYLYSSRECQPIYEGGQCCPTRFECKTRSERGLDPKKCYYKGQEYEKRLTIERGTGCFVDCRCLDTRQLNSYSSIACPSVDCPRFFSRSKPGCRYIFAPDQCCEVGKICDEVPSDSFDCEWEGKSYKLGDKMYFTGDDKCQYCICTENFTNPRGSGCQKMNCGRDTSSIEKGCAFLYFEDDCCPFRYICPNQDKIKVLESCKSQINDEREHCSFGEVDIKYGSTVDVTENCKIKCRCMTPPDLSCTQYKSCEEAAEKECINKGNETLCSVINCPDGCNTEKDLKTGCDICFCSDLSYSCPEATCPSSCENKKIEMNETSGCYECTCN